MSKKGKDKEKDKENPEIDESRVINERIQRSAEEHWAYSEAIILEQIRLMKYLYIQAYKHGLKHGLEKRV